MSKIPTLADNPRISMVNVPREQTLSPDAASATTRAMGNIAGQATDMLTRYRMQQVAERRKAERVNKLTGFSSETNKEVQELDLQFSSTSGDGFTNTVLSSFDSRVKRTLASTQDDTVRKSLELDFAQERVRIEQKAMNREFSIGKQYTLNTLNNRTKELANRFNNEYDLESSALETNRTVYELASTQYLDNREKQLKLDEAKDIQLSMFKGVISRGDIEELQKVKSDLMEEDYQPLLSITSEQKQGILNDIDRQLVRQEERVVKGVTSEYKDTLFALESGAVDFSDPMQKSDIQQVERNIINTMPPDKASKMLSELRTYSAVNETVSKYATSINDLKPDELASKLAVGEGLQGAVNTAKAKEVLTKMKSNMIAEFKKDPATYITKYDRSIAEMEMEIMAGESDPRRIASYINAKDTAFSQMGLPIAERKYLPEKLRNHYGKNVQAMIDKGATGQAVVMLDQFKQQFGDHAFRVWDELELDKEVAVSMEIEDVIDRTEYLNDVSQKDAIAQNFKANDDFKSVKDYEIHSLIAKDPFYKSMIAINGGKGSNAYNNAKGVLDAATIRYKKLRLKMDEDEAVKEAISIFSKDYDVIDNGAYPISVKRGTGSSSEVRRFIDTFSNQEVDYVRYLDAKLPGKGGVELPKEDQNANIKDKGVWLYDKKQNALRLTLGANTQVNNSKGEPIVIPFSDIKDITDTAVGTMTEEKEAIRRETFLRRQFKSKSPWRAGL